MWLRAVAWKKMFLGGNDNLWLRNLMALNFRWLVGEWWWRKSCICLVCSLVVFLQHLCLVFLKMPQGQGVWWLTRCLVLGACVGVVTGTGACHCCLHLEKRCHKHWHTVEISILPFASLHLFKHGKLLYVSQANPLVTCFAVWCWEWNAFFRYSKWGRGELGIRRGMITIKLMVCNGMLVPVRTSVDLCQHNE